MTCMKCGREIDPEQVFCEDCLLEMKKYPVSPNAVVQLPLRRQSVPTRKAAKRRTVTPEEQVKTLKKRVLILGCALAVTTVLVLGMIHPTVNFFLRSYYRRPGQNYTTITPTTVPTEATQASETVDPFLGMAD